VGHFGVTNPSPVSYERYRFLPQIMAHAVWLYFRFRLSLRLVDVMLLERAHWRAVDQDGYDLLKRLLRKQGCRSRRMVSDTLNLTRRFTARTMSPVSNRQCVFVSGRKSGKRFQDYDDVM
jgi:transposase-like protein